MTAHWTVILERNGLSREKETDVYVGLMQIDATFLSVYEQAQAAVRAAKEEVLKADLKAYKQGADEFKGRPSYGSYSLLFVFQGHPPEPYYFGWQTGMDV